MLQKGTYRACGSYLGRRETPSGAVMIRQKMRLEAGQWAGERRENGLSYKLDHCRVKKKGRNLGQFN